MISTFADGSQTATGGGTEDFLSSPNVQGKFTLVVDLNAMQAGDVTELRVYKMTRASGTSRRVYAQQFQNAQPADALVVMLPEVWNDLTDTNAVRFSLTQTFGTGRAYPWAVLKEDALAPTVSGRTLDVTATGGGAIDWGNVENPTTTLVLSGTTVKTATDVEADTQDLQARLPAALVGGRIDASVGAMAANVVTAASIATDAIDSDALAASAVTEIQAGLTAPTAAQVADAVWDEVLAGHLTAGSTGAALNAAGGAGDPWTTPLPGAYGAGTAGKIVGDALDATVSSRATPAQVNTEADTALADVGLTTTITGRIDVAVSSRLATAGYTAPLDAAGTRTAVGLASANLDTQLDALPTAAENATAVWASGTRTLTSFGTLVADVATAVWAAGTRTLTSFGTLVADVWAGVPTAFFAKFFTQDSGQIAATAVAGSVVKEIVDASGGAAPSAATIADAVWDELMAGHVLSGSTAEALAAAAAGAGGPTATEIADEILTRDWTAVSGEAARSVLNALRFLRNKWDVTAGTLTVTKEDDTAVAWSAALTTAAGASPITGSDPA